MKDTNTGKRPQSPFLKVTDTVRFFHMQLPQWLFQDRKYKPLSLEAKVTYAFLFNRFQLSRLNGWVNDEGEVFIVYPRKKLAEDMGISYRKAITSMGELADAGLIWEHRIGRGSPNRIYITAILSENGDGRPEQAPSSNASASQEVSAVSGAADPDAESRSADFVLHTYDDAIAAMGGNCPEKGPDSLPFHGREPCAWREDADTPGLEVQNRHFKECAPETSGGAPLALQGVRKLHSSNIESSNTERSQSKAVSPSVCAHAGDDRDRRTDTEPVMEMELELEVLREILNGCELDVLPREEVGVFENAIIRLYYSDSYRAGSAVLPQPVIRRQLHQLDGMILLDTREKLRRNLDKDVKNSTRYVMTALLNNIWETKSDLMVDPYLNQLGSRPVRTANQGVITNARFNGCAELWGGAAADAAVYAP